MGSQAAGGHLGLDEALAVYVGKLRAVACQSLAYHNDARSKILGIIYTHVGPLINICARFVLGATSSGSGDSRGVTNCLWTTSARRHNPASLPCYDAHAARMGVQHEGPTSLTRAAGDPTLECHSRVLTTSVTR